MIVGTRHFHDSKQTSTACLRVNCSGRTQITTWSAPRLRSILPVATPHVLLCDRYQLRIYSLEHIVCNYTFGYTFVYAPLGLYIAASGIDKHNSIRLIDFITGDTITTMVTTTNYYMQTT